MLGIVGCGDAEFAEIVGAGAAGAMLHSGDHVEAHEGIGLRLAHGGLNAFVVVDGIERRNAGVVPSMIENEFAAVGLERFQVGVGEAWNGGELSTGRRYGLP